MAAKREYVTPFRKRYRAARRKRERMALLDELIRVAGYTRKHAITRSRDHADEPEVTKIAREASCASRPDAGLAARLPSHETGS